ncbi:DNA-3-methyladenine glycosylase [Patescibacteria group bacterium]|nr:DNA-3-methyladenine glycosylase [Patescibacteria group bacterium]
MGKLLIREVAGIRYSGIIVETEAYRGFNDTACHAHKGPTTRCEVMFREGGFVYVYLTYGVHNMLNLVTEKSTFPAAVLIRAVEPVDGVEKMAVNRNVKNVEQLTSGPGKLTKAFDIDRNLSGIVATRGEHVWVEIPKEMPNMKIGSSERIGIDYANEDARSWKWRYFIYGNRFVSKYCPKK